MPGVPKVVRFAEDDTYYEPIPPTPSPTYSTSSLPSTSGPDTPPPIQHAGSPYAYKPLPGFSPAVDTIRLPYPALPKGPVHIHPALGFAATPAFSWDVAYHPSKATPQLSDSVLAAPATSPPLPSITIISRLLPWSINVTPAPYPYSPRRGGPAPFVTVGDVLGTIHHILRLAVRHAEYDKLPSLEAKHFVNVAYFSRCGGNEEESRKGVRRIDFLGGRRRFLGLSSSHAGPHVWVLNVS